MNDTKAVHVLVVNGSPHPDGNTATLMKWIAQGCEENGASVQWIDVSKKHIQYCKGCHMCLKTGSCVITDDDCSMIHSQITQADGIIIGSPVYDGHVSAQLKTLIDRFALFSLYMGSFDSTWALGVATSGVAPTRSTAKECLSLFGKKAGVCLQKTASLSGGYQQISIETHPGLKKQAIQKGKRFTTIIQKQPRLSTGSIKLVWIRFLRKHFLKKLITNHPEEFAGVIEQWKTKGWI